MWFNFHKNTAACFIKKLRNDPENEQCVKLYYGFKMKRHDAESHFDSNIKKLLPFQKQGKYKHSRK